MNSLKTKPSSTKASSTKPKSTKTGKQSVNLSVDYQAGAANKPKVANQPRGANKRLGRFGEDLSNDYLIANDFEILERNWTCEAGEADVIAIEYDTLVFIEVKTRSSQKCGLPEDSVNQKKRRKYENIAINYLATHNLPSSRVRFDVISLLVIDEKKVFLRHHRDAYCMD